MSIADSTAQIEYRTIERFLGYRFGDDGSAWVFKNGEWKKRRRYLLNNGYAVVSVCGQSLLLHRLILEAFKGPCPIGMETRHFPDRDKSNCRADNLQWGTPVENTNDQRTHGTFVNGVPPVHKGSKNHASKLTEAIVSEILGHCSSGKCTKEIAKSYKVSRRLVQKIAAGTAWGHVERLTLPAKID